MNAMELVSAGAKRAHACISDGDTVILDVNGEKQAFVTIKKNAYAHVKQAASLRAASCVDVVLLAAR